MRRFVLVGMVMMVGLSRAQKLRSAGEIGGGMGVPVLGFWPGNGGGEVRALVGVPSAAMIGAGLGTAVPGERYWVAPGGEWALRCTSEAMDLRTGALTESAGVAVRAVWFSESGRYALVGTEERTVQFEWSREGLRRMAEFPKAQEGAVSGDGAWVAWANGEGEVFVAGEGGVRRVYVGRAVNAIAFGAEDRQLLVVDRGRKELVSVAWRGEELTVETVVNGLELGRSAWLRMVSDGALLVDDGGGGWDIGLQSGVARRFEVPGGVTGMERLESKVGYWMTVAEGETAWMLWRDEAGQWKTYFAAGMEVRQ